MSKKIKIILGYPLGFICALLISILTLLIILKTSIFNKDYVFKVIRENDYYEKIVDDTKEEMENFMVSSGFPYSILDDIYTIDDVKEDIDYYINNMYNGEKTVIDKKIISEKLNNNINDYLKKNNVSVLNPEDITSFVDEIASIYDKEVTLYHTFDGMLNKVPKLERLVNKGIIIVGSVLVVIIILLMVVIKTISLGTCMFASSLILFFLRFVILEKIDIINILIVTEHFSDLIQIIMLDIRKLMLIASIILLIIGLMTILVSSIKNKSYKVLKRDN